MSALQSSHWRAPLLPVLLLVALLLPTLHIHPLHEHDHDGDLHQHAIIHADFFSASSDDHEHAEKHGEVTLGDSSVGRYSQTGFSALIARSVASALKCLERSPQFILVVEEAARTQLHPLTQFLKPEHPPPGTEVFLGPNLPRSPPRLA